MSSGHEQAGALLASDAQVTAICCGSDVLALGVLTMLHEAGIEVPGSISVAGYDDIEFDSAVTPKLSTVSQPFQGRWTQPRHVSSCRGSRSPRDLPRRSSCKDV